LGGYNVESIWTVGGLIAELERQAERAGRNALVVVDRGGCGGFGVRAVRDGEVLDIQQQDYPELGIGVVLDAN
jgi:hypothetical protein